MERRRLLNRIAIAIVLVALAVAAFSAYWSERNRAEARRVVRVEAERIVQLQLRLLESELDRYRLMPAMLNEYPDLRAAMIEGSAAAQLRLNQKLATLARRTGAPVIYALNASGLAIASSNADSADSFVGRSFAFRPYFAQAMRDGSAESFALGTVTGRPGLFLSRRIDANNGPVGVVVVKLEFEGIVKNWQADPDTTFITDEAGIILITTQPGLRFTSLTPLPTERRGAIIAARQFGQASLRPSGYDIGTGGEGMDPSRRPVLAVSQRLKKTPWTITHVTPLSPSYAAADRGTAIASLLFSLCVCGLAAMVWWVASRADRLRQRQSDLESAVTSRTSELQIANERYRIAREQLAQANRLSALGTISANIAHEINQPVAAIQTLATNARTFLDRQELDSVDANLDRIDGLTGRIASIIQEMRRFAGRRIDAVISASLVDIVEGALLLMADLYRAQKIEISLSPDRVPRDLKVMASRVGMEQILVNLLQNAADAMGSSADRRVLLAVEAKEELIQLIVADSGPGLCDAVRETLFDPFVSGKPNGIGLGLSISRDIAAQFGGQLTVTDSPIGGAAFVLTLRRAT